MKSLLCSRGHPSQVLLSKPELEEALKNSYYVVYMLMTVLNSEIKLILLPAGAEGDIHRQAQSDRLKCHSLNRDLLYLLKSATTPGLINSCLVILWHWSCFAEGDPGGAYM